MGLDDITWGDSRCEDRPYPPFSHWWVQVGSVDGGNVFICKFCHRVRWYPSSLNEAISFSNLIQRCETTDEAYQMILEKHPIAAVQMAKLGDLRNIRKFVTDDDQFRDILIVIEGVKDYLHKEDSDG